MGSCAKLFDLFEQKTQLMRLLEVSSRAEGVRIYIGGERWCPTRNSVVRRPPSSTAAWSALGVIGPTLTRMAYDRMIQIVDILAAWSATR